MMASGAQHTDPFAFAFHAMEDRLVERITERITERLASHLPVSQSVATIEESTLQADSYYDAAFLADRYGYGDTKSGKNAIYAIPENELRRTRVGQGRGRTLFYGADVLVYEGLITEEERDALQKRKLALLENPHQAPARLRRLGHPFDADQKPQTG